MRTIEIAIVVDANHRALIQLPDDIPPGTYNPTITIIENNDENKELKKDTI